MLVGALLIPETSSAENLCSMRQGWAQSLGYERVLSLVALKSQTRSHSPLRLPGGYGGVAAPDPIPNSAVKRPSADGTSSQDAGE